MKENHFIEHPSNYPSKSTKVLNERIFHVHISTNVLFHLQPVDLLPYRLEDARRQLELEGDFTLEALTILREAEDERRGENFFKMKSIT